MDLNTETLDSRSLEERLDELINSDELDSDENDELKAIQETKEETEGEGWDYGIIFINDWYFKDYAQELADDCGMTDGSEKWPLNCIDWEHATRELKYDYSQISIDGNTYWYNEA